MNDRKASCKEQACAIQIRTHLKMGNCCDVCLNKWLFVHVKEIWFAVLIGRTSYLAAKLSFVYKHSIIYIPTNHIQTNTPSTVPQGIQKWFEFDRRDERSTE